MWLYDWIKLNVMADIDVIIPVYNCERFLEQAVLSAVRQTLTPSRVLVCDDGSTDDTPKIAQYLSDVYPIVEYLRLPHGGEAAARNAGLRASSASYIAFLDADDIWMPSKLQSQMDIFSDSNSSVGVVHCGYYVIDENGSAKSEAHVAKPTKKGDIFWDLLVNEYAVTGSASAVIVRREVIEEVGYFDERLFHGADADMWLRLANISHYDFVSEPLVALRVHGNSVQRRNAKQRAVEFFLQQLLYLEKWKEKSNNNPAFNLMLRKRALLFMLPSITSPLQINNFYHRVKECGNSLVQDFFFKNRVELWGALVAVLLRYFFWRLRKILLNERSRFNG